MYVLIITIQLDHQCNNDTETETTSTDTPKIERNREELLRYAMEGHSLSCISIDKSQSEIKIPDIFYAVVALIFMYFFYRS